MAIEYRVGERRHRCTDCGAKWHPDSAEWQPCLNPLKHYCPKCSAKPPGPEPEPCDQPCHKWSAQVNATGAGWRFCPLCGVKLGA